MVSFPRHHRLIRKIDFQNVFQSKSKISTGSLILLYVANHQAHSRLGIIINKAKVRLSVKRNFMRRILRECYRHYASKINGFDMVILLRQSYVLDKTIFKQEADALFEKLRIKLAREA